MVKKEKFTFKKQPKETGLTAVGRSHPSTDIKHNKQVVGMIAAPDWKTKDDLWSIRLQVVKNDKNEDGNPNCEWNWIRLKAKFDTEPEARKFLNKYVDSILDKGLYHDEDD